VKSDPFFAAAKRVAETRISCPVPSKDYGGGYTLDVQLPRNSSYRCASAWRWNSCPIQIL